MGLAAALAFALPADADQRYIVSGSDLYRVGDPQTQTTIVYHAIEELSVSRAGGGLQFKASARGTRAGPSGSMPINVSFEQDMSPQGELIDRGDRDPDYLTILNQPFAVQLDAATLDGLRRLRGRLPFKFPAPMTGGTLEGFLQRGFVAPVSSRPALGVDFDAAGPISGPLPDRPQMTIAGSIRMRGTAYYALQGAPLLLALRETLTISGVLRTAGRPSPVTLVYRRSIKAAPLNRR